MGWEVHEPDSTKNQWFRHWKRLKVLQLRDLRICSFESSQRWQRRTHWSYWQAWETDELARVCKENDSNPHHLGRYQQVRQLSSHLRQHGLTFKTDTTNMWATWFSVHGRVDPGWTVDELGDCQLNCYNFMVLDFANCIEVGGETQEKWLDAGFATCAKKDSSVLHPHLLRDPTLDGMTVFLWRE